MDGREAAEKALSVAVPALVGGIVTATSNPRMDTTVLVWLIVAIIALGGLWASGARRRRREAEADALRRDRELKQHLDELKRLSLENLEISCRIAIYDPHFSLSEKVEHYQVYASHGWNHDAKHHMDELVGEDIDGWLSKRKGLHGEVAM